MFQIINNVISLTRGDTANFTLKITDADGSNYDYSEDNVLFTVKTSVYTNEIILQKTVQYGEDIVIEHDDTASLPYGEYWFDVQLTNAAGDVATVITPQKFRLMKEVTF